MPRVAVVGYGEEGRAAVQYWRSQGDQVTILDANPDLKVPAGVEARLGDGYLDRLDDFDLIVRSPGIKPSLLKTQRPISSVTREFLARCPAPVIGVTGTKGKGTTSTLITKMLESAGQTVHLGGNIGRPPLEFLDQIKPSHYVVLELSSFQLMDLEQSPSVAVCLMIATDHLDWHSDREEYVAAKGRIFSFQQPGDRAVYNARNQDSTRLAKLSPGTKVPYLDPSGAEVRNGQIWMQGVKIMAVDEIGLIGPHNQENVCAAVAAVWEIVSHNPEPLRMAIKTFTGLPHRLQLVGEVAGVRYYDDSFATTPETTIAAIQSLAESKVLILGGSDKGSDYAELAAAVKAGQVRRTILIGATARAIAKALDQAGYKDYLMGPGQMAEIVKLASQVAPSGGVVLLSPGCASFGLFRNYKDRGDQFAGAVKGLK